MTRVADPVAAHVTAIDRALVGPVKARRSMIMEVRHGLEDAATAHRDAGLDPTAAATAAVRDFGAVAEIVPLLQEELTARQARATALLLALVFPALLGGWDLLWRSGAGWVGRPPDAVIVLARVQDWATGAIGVAALALLLISLRRRTPPRRAAALAGVTAAGGALVCGGTGIVMNLANADQAAAMVATQPMTVVALVASGAAFGVVMRSAVRSLRLARASDE